MKRVKQTLVKEKYYLINKDLMKEIKKEYNYNNISEFLKKNNITENDNKKILSAIRDISDSELNKYLGKNDFKEKLTIENNKTNLKTIFNKTDICNIIMIYDNFEIIEKDIIKLFIDDINKLNDCYLECTINEGKIIIHYPDNFVENQYASVIGKLDEDNSFISEYILIYKNQNVKFNHLNNIIGQLNNYLNNLSFINKSEPILKDNSNSEIIGTIIKYCDIDNNIINNNVNKDNYNNKTNNNYIINNNVENHKNKEIIELKEQLNLEIMKNKQLSDKIFSLENELQLEKNKNISLNDKVNQLNIELNNQLKKYNDLTNNTQNQSLQNINMNYSKESLYQTILEKDKEIKELRIKLSRFPFELKEGEKLMTVNFISADQKVQHYSLICKNTDTFNVLEKKLYEDYKEFYETENYFTFNGNKIHKLKSLDENNIRNNDIIMLNVIEF